MAQVPRVVWMLWLQGWDAPPPLVQACRRSWERLNPTWDVRLLDATAVADLPEVARLTTALPAAASDVVRAHVLRDHGGVWADATSFCTQPLDRWLLPRLEGADFFAFDSPGYRRMLSSWFLAAAPGTHVMTAWAERADDYWRGRTEPDEYFWFHHLFGELYAADARFRSDWDAAARVPADGPHYFSPYGDRFAGPMTRRMSARLAAVADPVYKLTNRVDAATAAPDSAYRWFVEDGVRALPASRTWRLVDHGLVATRSRAKRTVNRARARLAR